MYRSTWWSRQVMLTPVAQLLTRRVQMDMSEFYFYGRLRRSVTLIEGDGTYTVAEYLGMFVMQY